MSEEASAARGVHAGGALHTQRNCSAGVDTAVPRPPDAKPGRGHGEAVTAVVVRKAAVLAFTAVAAAARDQNANAAVKAGATAAGGERDIAVRSSLAANSAAPEDNAMAIRAASTAWIRARQRRGRRRSRGLVERVRS